jgi:hypothetical protein
MLGIDGSNGLATDTGKRRGLGFEPTDRRNLLAVFRTVPKIL